MDIINPELPKGRKFFPIEEKLHTVFELFFSGEFYYPTTTAYRLYTESKVGLHPDEFTLDIKDYSRWEVMDDTFQAYPTFKIPADAFKCMGIGTRITSHRKTGYVSSTRLGHLGIPRVKDHPIIVNWDPVRKGLVVHNAFYEGELVSNKSGTVSKQLNQLVEDSLGDLQLAEVLGEDVIVTWEHWSRDSIQQVEYIEEGLATHLRGELDVDGVKRVALASGLYTVVRIDDPSGATWQNGALKTVQALERIKGAKVKLSSALRTRLVYMYGGYKLPENYQDWFDG